MINKNKCASSRIHAYPCIIYFIIPATTIFASDKIKRCNGAFVYSTETINFARFPIVRCSNMYWTRPVQCTWYQYVHVTGARRRSVQVGRAGARWTALVIEKINDAHCWRRCGRCRQCSGGRNYENQLRGAVSDPRDAHGPRAYWIFRKAHGNSASTKQNKSARIVYATRRLIAHKSYPRHFGTKPH